MTSRAFVNQAARAIGDLVNVAGLTSEVADPRPENNSASKTITVSPAADLSVAIAHSPGRSVIGSNLSYTVTVTNSGPSDATQVVLTNRLTADGRLVASTGRCTDADGVIVCNIGSLDSEASSTLTIHVKSLTKITTSTVSVTANEIDTIAKNNSAAETFQFRSRNNVVILLPDDTLPPVSAPVTKSIPTPVPDFDVDRPVVPPFELPAPDQAPAVDDDGRFNVGLLMVLVVMVGVAIGIYVLRGRGRRGKDSDG